MKRFLSVRIFLFVFIFFYLTCQQAFPIDEESVVDARAVALGSIRALSDEMVNPAHLSFQLSAQAGISVYNRFQMQELNTNSAYFLYPNRILDAGIQVSHFGYEDYNTTSVESGFSKKLSSAISLGIKVFYFNRSSLLEECSQSGLTGGIGFLFQISKTIRLGLLADNLVNTLDRKDYFLHAGMDYQVLNNCHVLIEASSDFKDKIHLSLGFDYGIIPQLYFRAGINTNQRSPSLGAAYTIDRFTVGLSFAVHQILGNSSAIEVSYLF